MDTQRARWHWFGRYWLGIAVAALLLAGISYIAVSQVSAEIGQANHNCGVITTSRLGVPPNPTKAREAERCFARAFAQCQAASLHVAFGGTDVAETDLFDIQPGLGSCTVSVQWSRNSNGQITSGSTTCNAVNQQPDGVHITDCDPSHDVLLPPS